MLRAAFCAAVEDPDSLRDAEIPIERVGGPILLISGEDDHFWPSAAMAELAVRRAAGHGFAHKLTHLRYPDAGHNCAGVPGIPLASWIDHPLTGGRSSFGGTPAINARARIDSWPRVIAFLRETLPPIISGLALALARPTASRPTPDMSPGLLRAPLRGPRARILARAWSGSAECGRCGQRLARSRIRQLPRRGRTRADPRRVRPTPTGRLAAVKRAVDPDNRIRLTRTFRRPGGELPQGHDNHRPREPLLDCPTCGLPAEIADRFALDSTAGSVST